MSAICHYLSEDISQKLLCVLVYCNSLLAGCARYLLSNFQKVWNNIARLIFRTSSAPMPHICFVFFASFLLSSGLNTYFFSLRSSLVCLSDPLHLYTPLQQLCSSANTLVLGNAIVLHKVQWSAVFLFLGSSCLEPTPCFIPSYHLCQFFQIFLENLFSKPFFQSCCPKVHVCVCVRERERVCVCARAHACMCIGIESLKSLLQIYV